MQNSDFDEGAWRELNRDVVITANAGSGKTHLLVEHYFEILSAGFSPAQIVAFTFTQKAALDLKHRILQRLVTHPAFSELPDDNLADFYRQINQASIGTIASFCFQLLQSQNTVAENPAYQILEENLERQWLRRLIQSHLKFLYQQRDAKIVALLTVYGPKDLANVLEEYIDHLKNESQQETAADLPGLLAQEAELLQILHLLGQEILSNFSAEKKSAHCYTFLDIEKAALAFLQNLNASKTIPKNLFYRHLLIDEFQDTSPLQIAIVQSLRQLYQKHRLPLRLFCVGDEKQSIYRFRHVDAALIHKTEKLILAEGGLSWRSCHNYRSDPCLIELVNTYTNFAFPKSQPSIPTRASTPQSEIKILNFATHETKASKEALRQVEAQVILDEIQKLIAAGVALDQIAILYRSHASAQILIQQLKAAGLAYQVKAAQDLLERQEILDLQNLIFFLTQNSDDKSLLGILRSPLFLLSDTTLWSLRQHWQPGISFYDYLRAGEWKNRIEISAHEAEKTIWCLGILHEMIRQAGRQSPFELLCFWNAQLNWSGIYQAAQGDEGAELCIQQFLTFLEGLEASRQIKSFLSLAALLRDLDGLGLGQDPLPDLMPREAALQLMSVHGAKGLQFSSVFLLDMNRSPRVQSPWIQAWQGHYGLALPNLANGESPRYQAIKSRQQEAGQAEAKRLLYVALTRAQHRLFVSLGPGKPSKGSFQEIFLFARDSRVD